LFQPKQYDYIFCGAGCAALSLAVRMVRSKTLRDKRILLIDKARKDSNDRTWCFWEQQNGFFEDIVYREWEQLIFYGEKKRLELDIAPYTYKMIRGIDFYNYCLDELGKHANVELLQGECNGIFPRQRKLIVNNDDFPVGDAVVFSSVFHAGMAKRESVRLLQHFKGWIIQTEENCFNPAEATLMDFRVSQEKGTCFCYVLPLAANKALVEYTFFSPEVLADREYENGLRDYITASLNLTRYQVIEKEFGVIPMTNGRLTFDQGNEFYHIGTAGGQTKASSGYTFSFIQKQSDAIIDCLETGAALSALKETPARFRFYDNTLLEILARQPWLGRKIFTQLFSRNRGNDVLKFLDNDSSRGQELKIISTLTPGPFLRAAARQFFR
jgi:lycopene beta-cyclase